MCAKLQIKSEKATRNYMFSIFFCIFAPRSKTASNMENQNLWNTIMDMAMRLPGMQVDRSDFLRDTLHRFCTRQQLEVALTERPDVVIREDVLREIAQSVINHHVLRVTTISAAAGLPGGWGAWVALPADLGQYYWHCFVVAQKLAYLYGYPDLSRIDGELARNLTVFVGVMMGVAKANEAINTLARKVVEQTVQQMAADTLQRAAWFQVVQSVAQAIGIKLSKKKVATIASKLIPVAGAALSGGFSFLTFKKGANRLNRQLQQNMAYFQTVDSRGVQPV